MTCDKLFHVVALGASAGGLNALEQFFDAMPSDSGMAFVVIQHLSPDFKSLMDDLLARHTTMVIRQATDGAELAPDTIYLSPPRFLMTVAAGRISLREKTPVMPSELPIDTFFRSLAADRGERAIGIVLSGTGSDGSRGIRDIRDAGGLVIVQTPDSAQFDGMPRAAIAAGCYDFQLPPVRIPRLLREYVQDPLAVRQRAAHTVELCPGDGEYAEIFALLRRSYTVDFAKYKLATVERRVTRRMELRSLSSTAEYATLLCAEPEELDALCGDLLIGVTEFFRDQETFDHLAAVIAPDLIAAAQVAGELRVWSACCATGEEAYSLAIILTEAAEAAGYTGKITIFATDVHKRSLESAGNGLYGTDRLTNVSPERKARFFRPEVDDTWRIVPEIRRLVVFAPHNLLSDPPFTALDLACCRNMLIYLRPEVQDRVIATFHFALKVSGVLFLGSSEGTGSHASEFETLDLHHKIYRKRRDTRLPFDLSSVSMPSGCLTPQRPVRNLTRSISLDRRLLSDYDLLLDRYLPAGILVDEQRQVLHFFGNVRPYLRPMRGRADYDMLAILAEELHVAVSTTLQRAERDRTTALVSGVPLTTVGSALKVTVSVEPLSDEALKSCHFFISFRSEEQRESLDIPHDAGEVSGAFAEEPLYRRYINDLELDLKLTRENLQASNEELQASNEELQATNEELLASNEELQSTNEELHSVNEELFTVNAEFERKNTELKELNLDHENLLASIDVGTVFVDHRFCIRKYNTAVTGFFRLLPHDIGRPIEHIAYHLSDQSRLMDDIRQVLATGAIIEKEDVTPSGSRYILIRLLPFRNDTGGIEGVVLLFTDITQIKESELTVQRLYEELRLRNAELGRQYETERCVGERIRMELRLKDEDLLETQRIAGMAAFKWDMVHDEIALADSFRQFFPGLDTGCSFDRGSFLALLHPDDRELLVAQVAGLADGERRQMELRLEPPDGGTRYMVCSVRRHDSNGNLAEMVVGVMHDITERQMVQQRLLESEALLRARLEAIASPDLDISPDDLVRIFDAPAVQEMMNEFYAVTRTGIGIIDLNGRVMVATGWQRVCTDFHRKHSESRNNCLESDLALASGVAEGEFKLYRCKNGMWDMVTPLVAEGKHFANIFLGQFFFDDEHPDFSFFEQQAERFGFDPDAYLSALREAPVWSRDQVYHTMSFYARFASLIARLCVGSVRIAKTLEARNRTEQQLREAQKMEAIGILAGGIAHDFNNILHAITGYADLLSIDPGMSRYLELIQQACQRAAELTRGLLAYSRKQTLSIRRSDLAELVESATCFVRRIIGEHIELTTIHDDAPLTVLADATQIQQVFINLITNARDAMPSGGRITIHTGVRELNQAAAAALGAPPGRYAAALVTDTGVGMSDELTTHIFEPFFTTKDVGKGTGLGLAIVYGIIRQHEGFIECISAPGAGTTFTLLFPLAPEDAATEQESGTDAFATGGGETILLVEDETEVRNVMDLILRRFGYRVITAASGAEAVASFLREQKTIDLLLTDVVMPGKSGIAVSQAIHAVRPDVPVLFMSGYPMRALNADGLTPLEFDCIAKPVSAGELLRKVRAALDRAAP